MCIFFVAIVASGQNLSPLPPPLKDVHGIHPYGIQVGNLVVLSGLGDRVSLHFGLVLSAFVLFCHFVLPVG